MAKPARAQNPIPAMSLAGSVLVEALLSTLVQGGDGDKVMAIIAASRKKLAKMSANSVARAADAHLAGVARDLGLLGARAPSDQRQ